MRVLFLLLLFVAQPSFAKYDTITVPSNQFYIDTVKGVIVTNFNVEHINTTWKNAKSSLRLDVIYQFDKPVNTIQIGTKYLVTNSHNKKQFSVYFTQLPLISISLTGVFTPSAQFTMIGSDQRELFYTIGIGYRGGSTRNLPKKSMEIEFWKDGWGDKTLDVSLLGMHANDSWNLQAMYNEPSRINSKTCNDLWRKMHTIQYSNSEPDAINGIRMEYAELFLDGEYRGVYCISEKVNKKQLRLKKYDGTIHGELYKGDDPEDANTFTAAPSYSNRSNYWSGFEFKYPNETINWSNLYKFVDFVVNATDEAFYDSIKNYFALDNAVDYFIFLNVVRATDNTGKNIYIARYDAGTPYFYVPWDLDGTLGYIWDGSQEDSTKNLLFNGLYQRLWKDYSKNGFREQLQLRWQELRSGIITHDAILNMLTENYTFLLRNGVYEREHIAWPGYQVKDTYLQYMSQWLKNRLTYLDSVFSLAPVNLNSK